MRNMKYIFPTALLFLLICCGCSREVSTPPTERNNLTVRFFRSLRNNDGDAAALQAQKLYAMEKRNYFLLNLIAVQQANECTQEAQKHLNAGDINAALKAIEKGLRLFPGNRELLKHQDKLRKLRRAEKLFLAMNTAPNPAAMNSALIAARNGLAGLDSPALEKYFKQYQSQITTRAKEQQEASVVQVKVPIRSFDDK